MIQNRSAQSASSSLSQLLSLLHLAKRAVTEFSHYESGCHHERKAKNDLMFISLPYMYDMDVYQLNPPKTSSSCHVGI